MMNWLLILSLAAVALVIALVWKKSKGGEINSFWDVLRNPGAMPYLKQFRKHVEDSAADISGSADEIADLVDYFVFEAKTSDDDWTEKRIIAQLGEEAYPRALEILRDVSTHERLMVPTGDPDSIKSAPICRLAEIFDQDAPPPPEAAALLSPFLQSKSADIRRSVALIIASVGSSRSLPDLQRALQDEDEYVRSWTLMGIERALSDKRIIQSDKSVFYQLVAGMWPEDTSFSVCDTIPKLLLTLDRARAEERLLQPDLLAASFGPVWRILDALARESIEVPREKLLMLIQEVDKETLAYPMQYVLGGALCLLGQHRAEADLSTLERLLAHPDEQVSLGAIKGLYSYHRYFDLIRDPWLVVDTDGWDALTEAEKYICAIEELNGEVNNGGFAQYYFNSGGNHWKEALNGLRAVGATKRHEIMAATIEKFGKTDPSPARSARNSQLAKIVRKQEDPFKAQDTAWYQTEDELLDRLMFRYNLANRKGREKAGQLGVEE